MENKAKNSVIQLNVKNVGKIFVTLIVNKIACEIPGIGYNVWLESVGFGGIFWPTFSI